VRSWVPSLSERRSVLPSLPSRLPVRALIALLAGLLAGAAAAPAQAARQIPVGMSNVANQVMNSGRYVYAIRFVPDRDTRVYRFFSGFKLEGSEVVDGDGGSYADGDGGVILARLVEVKRNGEPDVHRVIATERVAAAKRYRESRAQYGSPDTTQLFYFDMDGARLRGNRMYAMVYSNVADQPARNWFSENSPVVSSAAAGPNDRNTTNPNARHPIAGLDPREAVAWSINAGRTWRWGRQVGHGFTHGAYSGTAAEESGTRLPWYGLQRAPGTRPVGIQPYYAYGARGSYTMVAHNVPRSTVLTQAGGYSPRGEGVGVVTVRNLRTGQSGVTDSLGSGLRKGWLHPRVRLARGDSYEISNSGTVFKQEGDEFIQGVFGVGGGLWPFRTGDDGADMAELFALPHPWFARA
jgi:hypothetical protein